MTLHETYSIFTARYVLRRNSIEVIKLTTIKKLRERANLTQAYVASKMFVTPAAVSNWEAGIREPKASQIPELCSILRCTPQELLGMKEE